MSCAETPVMSPCIPELGQRSLNWHLKPARSPSEPGGRTVKGNPKPSPLTVREQGQGGRLILVPPSKLNRRDKTADKCAYDYADQ